MLLLAMAISAVVGLYLRSGPDFVAGALSRLLGRYVEIDSMKLRPGEMFEVELAGVRVYPGSKPEGEPLLEVPSARGWQSWPLLVVGRFVPAQWEIDSPVVRTELRASGGEGGLSLPRLPSVSLTARNGTLLLRRPGRAAITVSEIELRTSVAGLRSSLTGSAQGVLAIGERSLGPFEVALSGTPRDLGITGELGGLDLAALPDLESLDAKGRATGSATLRVRPDELQGSLDLRVAGLSLQPDRFRAPIAPKLLRGELDWSWDGAELELRPQRLRADDLVVSGQVRIGRGRDARVQASLDVAPFEPGLPAKGRLNVISLLGLRHDTWASQDRRIEGGRVLDGKIELDLPLSKLGNAFAFREKLGTEALRLSARVEGGTYRTSPDSTLENMSGVVRIVGNRLDLRDLRMTRGGNPLPRVDVVIEGMHRLVALPVAERGQPRGPGVSLPGLGPAVAALRSDADGQPPPEIRFSEAQIGYPAFILPVRDATGTVHFPDNTLQVDAPQAVVGGAPASLRARWNPDESTVTVQIFYQDGEAPPRRDPGTRWLSGKFETDELHLGRWKIHQPTSQIEARGALLRFQNLKAVFAGGPARGWGTVSLAEKTGAPYEFLAGVRDGNVAALAEPLSRPQGSLRGKLAGEGRFQGRLEPGREFLDDARVGLSVLATDGRLSELPVLVALLRVPSLQGVRGLFGADLPYDAISADVTIRDGLLHSDNLALQGPELRAHLRGDVDLRSEDLECDYVLAFLMLETVDRMIGQVPLLGQIVLGEDQSLVTLYLQVDGPLADPRVRPLAPSAVAWAGRLVASGVGQLRRLFGGSSEEAREQ